MSDSDSHRFVRKNGCIGDGFYRGYNQDAPKPRQPIAMGDVTMEIDHKVLHSAIRKRDMTSIDKLLDAGMKPCLVEDDFNCYHLAMHCVDIVALEKLLAIDPRGANSRDPQGFTLIMKATDMDWVQVLTEHNADPNIRNNMGDNAFHHALRNPYPLRLRGDYIDFLLSSNVDINERNAEGRTVMDMAGDNPPEWDHYFRKFLNAGATIPDPDENGVTYLMKMVPYSNNVRTKIIDTLILHGADAAAKDRDGHNIIYYIFRDLSKMISNQIAYGIVEATFQIIYMLMDRGCELQGLDTVYETRFVIVHMKSDTSYQVDAIGLLCASMYNIPIDQLSRFLQEVVRQGHSLKPANPELMSPLTTFLAGRSEKTTPIILAIVKLFLEHGVDTTQRMLKFQDDDMQAWSDKLFFPDVLVFGLPRKVRCLRGRGPRTTRSFVWTLSFKHLENEGKYVLKLLMQNWGFPPLALMIFLLDEYIWKRTEFHSTNFTGLFEFLVNLGGRVVPNSFVYHIVKERLQAINAVNDSFEKMLTQFLFYHARRVSSLQQLCRIAIRAQFAGTDLPTSLSQLQIFAHGEFRPIPKDIANILQFGF